MSTTKDGPPSPSIRGIDAKLPPGGEPRPEPRPPSPPIPGIDAGIAPGLFNKALDLTIAQIKIHFGLPETTELPRALRTELENRIRREFARILQEIVATDIAAQVSAILKRPAFLTFDEQIRQSLFSTEHFRTSEEMGTILKHKADMLFNKRSAYIDAGFSSTEAMQIVLTEIEGKRT